MSEVQRTEETGGAGNRSHVGQIFNLRAIFNCAIQK
jgi:hypothetical protein